MGIANCIRNDDLNLWERDIKLIELHSLILITLRNIGKKSDEFLTFKNAAKPHNVSVDLYDLHFVQAIQILIGLDDRPEGTQKIEKLLGEKDHKDLENLTGSLRSYCRTNGRNSEYAFFRTKAQLWSPVLWFWFVRSSLHTLTTFYNRETARGRLNHSVPAPDFTEDLNSITRVTLHLSSDGYPPGRFYPATTEARDKVERIFKERDREIRTGNIVWGRYIQFCPNQIHFERRTYEQLLAVHDQYYDENGDPYPDNPSSAHPSTGMDSREGL